MSNRQLSFIAIIIVMKSFSVCGPSPEATAAPGRPKVTRLLDGGIESHWTPNYEGGWFMKGEELSPSSEYRKNNYIWTKTRYEDFILTLEYKLSEGVNSGVFVRADPSDPVQKGIEIQLLDGPSKHALNGELDKHSNGAIYDAVVPREYNNKPAGEWNALTVNARGSTISVYVNGSPIAEANLDLWRTPGKNPDGTENKFKAALATLPHSGKIGLQYHGGPVAFRNIRVTELVEDSPDITRVTPRRPEDEKEREYWLLNMIAGHGYSDAEIQAATGMGLAEIAEVREHLGPERLSAFQKTFGDRLKVLPYPGGRHPRIGFLDGAMNPQRETKASLFLPWDAEAYVVLDAPEAIFSNLGLTYLAHEHVPTIWTDAGVALKPSEWRRHEDGSLTMTRDLPNGISFSSRVAPSADVVHVELSLTNGTSEPLTGLRVQNCIMLKGAPEFADLTSDNKILGEPYVAVHNREKMRWVISAWAPHHRSWGNRSCPCLHSDPKFPDCPPGATVSVKGIVAFYEGSDIEAEFSRLDSMGWRNRIR